MQIPFRILTFLICIVPPYYQLSAQNPIIENMGGIADPHVRVFNDTIYLFSGHDATPEDKTWVMKDWRIFSTTDLVHWYLRDTISPANNYMGSESTDCWAGDAAERNGKYYFYFSDRKRGIGVMQANSPAGKYRDVLGKPLVAPMHDPTIFINNDSAKTPYIVYGDKEGGGYRIAKMNNDMVSLAEPPRPVSIKGELWEKAPIWMDKNYLFKYNNTYYLSWGRDYATAKNIYGPYTSTGSVGNGHHLDEYAHGSFFWWKGQFYHIWCYYLRPGYKYRNCIISYCHLEDNGNIYTDTNFLDQHFKTGVARYEADWSKIEAEWYYEISPGIRKKGNRYDGFVLSNIKNNGWVKYSNVNFDKKYSSIHVKARSNQPGMIEVRTGQINGKIIGTIQLNRSMNNSYSVFKAKLKPITGSQNIYLVIKGSGGLLANLDWFSFAE